MPEQSSSPPRTESPDDVKSWSPIGGVRFIRLWFTDILGQLKSFSINAQELDDAFEAGWGSTGPRSPASTRSRSRT